MAPKALEILLKVSKVDKREFMVTRERLQELLDQYRGDQLPMKYRIAQEVALDRAISLVSEFLTECEEVLEKQILNLELELNQKQEPKNEN